MSEALNLAREAADAGEVPVGALVLDADGRVVGRGRNRREADGDPLAHAEVMAMREAALRRGNSRNSAQSSDAIYPADSLISDYEIPEEIAAETIDVGDFTDSAPADGSRDMAARNAWNLADCTLVVTLEPCPMCAGAALQAHVGRIVFGAWDAKLGACGSVWDIPRDPHVGARPEVIGGVREAECADLLAKFFAGKRSASGCK
ncbi:nucleoside deaminase [Bifidobacterium sp. ESL0690]|nr:nucleoside deaminase [Bifidobacterium sp. ESL0690]WEV47817.1 nucleoside deaminase [Bifidobacterium sp. ESL0690]